MFFGVCNPIHTYKDNFSPLFLKERKIIIRQECMLNIELIGQFLELYLTTMFVLNFTLLKYLVF
jgi:hypothetical protein